MNEQAKPLDTSRELASLRRQIDRLQTRAAIEELCSAYGRACDERDLKRLVHLFTPEGTFKSKDGARSTSGRRAINDMYKGRFRVLGPTYHWTHNLIVTFDDKNEDVAYGQILGHAECFKNGKAMLSGSRYDDIFHRNDGVWLFYERAISHLYYMPVEEYAEGLGSRLRMRVDGEPGPADFPEKLPTWTTWEDYNV